MIKANELRIGNKFMVGVKAVTIESIHQQTLPDGASGQRSWHVYVSGFIQSDNHYCIMGTELVPIPLSKEVLEACGFVHVELDDSPPYEYWHLTELRGFQVWNFNKEHWIFDIADQAGIDQKHFKYLHQLQNLHFSITGQELIYKPSINK